MLRKLQIEAIMLWMPLNTIERLLYDQNDNAVEQVRCKLLFQALWNQADEKQKLQA